MRLCSLYKNDLSWGQQENMAQPEKRHIHYVCFVVRHFQVLQIQRSANFCIVLDCQKMCKLINNNREIGHNMTITKRVICC